MMGGLQVRRIKSTYFSQGTTYMYFVLNCGERALLLFGAWADMRMKKKFHWFKIMVASIRKYNNNFCMCQYSV